MWTSLSLSLCLSMSLSLSRLQDKSANATLAIISPRRPHTHIILDPLRVSQICMSLVCPSEREMLLFSPCDGLIMASARVFVFMGLWFCHRCWWASLPLSFKFISFYEYFTNLVQCVWDASSSAGWHVASPRRSILCVFAPRGMKYLVPVQMR